ncbi:uncharacterized protein BXZ73DRAFT_62961 [Epithele typhae]|uniref:uncharacterized protein n=1 Tax=Epithele typhae TaxID=378194 RepID=UPI002007FE2A|nr:uncharacterized protein BXZ73DRAFT_62961 [Epithele typhae]KAH9897078.1 hypothetical protein BXZ73DRAFT_62961 [Epithele typhae]
MRKWHSFYYGFYEPIPKIAYGKGRRRCHVFTCASPSCKWQGRRYLDKSDATSTGILQKHAIRCWGQEAVDSAREANMTADEVRKIVVSKRLSSDIKTYFTRKGKGSVVFSNRHLTQAETRWILMKTGRPNFKIPSPSTLARDTRTLFTRSRERIGRLLRDYDGHINIATDCWTSPNHRAFTAVTVHFLHNDEPISMLLDIVEVPKVRTSRDQQLSAY